MSDASAKIRSLVSWLDRGHPHGGPSGFRLSRNGFLVEVIRAAPRTARTRCASGQAAHLQAGEQVAPGWHWHAEPHLQLGPHAHDVAAFLVLAPVAAFAESTPMVDEFT